MIAKRPVASAMGLVAGLSLARGTNRGTNLSESRDNSENENPCKQAQSQVAASCLTRLRALWPARAWRFYSSQPHGGTPCKVGGFFVPAGPSHIGTNPRRGPNRVPSPTAPGRPHRRWLATAYQQLISDGADAAAQN